MSSSEAPRDNEDEQAAQFQRLRPALTGLAYRMLGTLSEAQDVVQEAYLRWHTATQVREPRAFLYQVVTRLCLDQLKSARARRESYVGTWLPEPVVDEAAVQPQGLTALSGLADDLSFALLLTLQRLTPAERAAFLLHDVFEVPFCEVGEALGHDEAHCRQLAVRARAHLRQPRTRFRPSPELTERLLTAFMTAVASGDVDGLRRLFTDEAVYLTDGGGRVSSALNPIHGPDRIARFLIGARAKFPLPADVRVRLTTINGLAGVVLETAGRVLQTFAVEITPEQRIAAVYTTRNPDKLAHLPVAS
jgi:RNA polymerase sigma-70 factor (ECF subfamily)